MLGVGGLACSKLGSGRHGKWTVGRPFVMQVGFVFVLQ